MDNSQDFTTIDLLIEHCDMSFNLGDYDSSYEPENQGWIDRVDDFFDDLDGPLFCEGGNLLNQMLYGSDQLGLRASKWMGKIFTYLPKPFSGLLHGISTLVIRTLTFFAVASTLALFVFGAWGTALFWTPLSILYLANKVTQLQAEVAELKARISEENGASKDAPNHITVLSGDNDT